VAGTKLDLAELARLRWIESLSRKELAERFGKTEVAMQNYFQALRRMDFQVPGLTNEERRKIQWASQN
jgi:hypothetical protein